VSSDSVTSMFWFFFLEYCYYILLLPRSRGDNTFGSVYVCPSIVPCACVCLFDCGRSPIWTIWPLTLIFACGSTLTMASLGFRSKSKVKFKQRVFVYTLPFEPVVWRRSILWLSLPSSANGNCERPLPVHWNCLFVSNQGAFNMSRISGRSALVQQIMKC